MNSVLQAWTELPPVFADRLMSLLCDPRRSYHGLHRTNELLLEADRHCQPHWLRPLRWAILYRTAVFDPLAPDEANAHASAELWTEHFPALHETARNVSGRWGEDVAAAIRAAADPFDRPEGLLAWQHALLDLDSGAFGLSQRAYEADRLLVLDEFLSAGGTPDQWARTRRRVLLRIEVCQRLFHLVYRERAAAARENAARDLAQLASC